VEYADVAGGYRLEVAQWARTQGGILNGSRNIILSRISVHSTPIGNQTFPQIGMEEMFRVVDSGVPSSLCYAGINAGSSARRPPWLRTHASSQASLIAAIIEAGLAWPFPAIEKAVP